MDLAKVEHMMRAAEAFDVTPLVRVPDTLPLSRCSSSDAHAGRDRPRLHPEVRRKPW